MIKTVVTEKDVSVTSAFTLQEFVAINSALEFTIDYGTDSLREMKKQGASKREIQIATDCLGEMKSAKHKINIMMPKVGE
jgi:hypothetical protein